jgi:hypothetical protein
MDQILADSVLVTPTAPVDDAAARKTMKDERDFARNDRHNERQDCRTARMVAYQRKRARKARRNDRHQTARYERRKQAAQLDEPRSDTTSEYHTSSISGTSTSDPNEKKRKRSSSSSSSGSSVSQEVPPAKKSRSK